MYVFDIIFLAVSSFELKKKESQLNENSIFSGTKESLQHFPKQEEDTIQILSLTSYLIELL